MSSYQGRYPSLHSDQVFTRRVPRPLSLEAGVVVPGLQAAITGVAAACVGFALGFWLRGILAGFLGFLGAGCGVFLGVWLVLLVRGQWLVWEVEQIAPAVPVVIEPKPIKIEVTDRQGMRMRYVEVRPGQSFTVEDEGIWFDDDDDELVEGAVSNVKALPGGTALPLFDIGTSPHPPRPSPSSIGRG